MWKIWHLKIKEYFDLPVNALNPVLFRRALIREESESESQITTQLIVPNKSLRLRNAWCIDVVTAYTCV